MLAEIEIETVYGEAPKAGIKLFVIDEFVEVEHITDADYFSEIITDADYPEVVTID